MIHELKTHPESFWAIHRGTKPFDLRKTADRTFAVRDTLHFREFDPATQTYTGEELRRRVSYVLPGGSFDLPADMCILGLEFPRSDLNRFKSEICDSFRFWVRELKASGQDIREPAWLHIDMAHSCLFERLLSGKKPFNFPPPKAFSSPWYSLIESQKTHQVEFWIHEDIGPSVNQGRGWTIEEKVSETEYILCHKHGLRCRVIKARGGNSIFAWDLTVLDIGEYAPVDYEVVPPDNDMLRLIPPEDEGDTSEGDLDASL